MGYAEIKEQLTGFRFHINALDFRAGSYGAALTYVEVREYQTALEQLAPGDWQEGAPTLLANTIVKEVALVAVVVPLTIAGRTEFGVSDFKTPTAARAQALKRAAANHGLGEYLYDVPDLRNAYQDSKLVVSKSSLIAQLYEHWGMDLPEGYQVEKGSTRQSYAPRQGGQQAAPASREGGIGPFSSKQVYKLQQLGLTDQEIGSVDRQQAREVMDRVFAGELDAALIRDGYLPHTAAPAPARSATRSRW